MIDNVKKVLAHVAADPQSGSYGIGNAEAMSWWKCREQFAPVWTPQVESLYFSHDGIEGQLESIDALIVKVERLLELDGESSFSPTNRPYAIWVSPHNFWKSCAMRRSFFTVLLRAGRKYNIKTNNFEEAVYAENYFAQTRDAVMRFLFGFTTFNTDNARRLTGYQVGSGWYTVFNGRSVLAVKAILERPGEKINPLGAAHLWT